MCKGMNICTTYCGVKGGGDLLHASCSVATLHTNSLPLGMWKLNHSSLALSERGLASIYNMVRAHTLAVILGQLMGNQVLAPLASLMQFFLCSFPIIYIQLN